MIVRTTIPTVAVFNCLNISNVLQTLRWVARGRAADHSSSLKSKIAKILMGKCYTCRVGNSDKFFFAKVENVVPPVIMA